MKYDKKIETSTEILYAEQHSEISNLYPHPSPFYSIFIIISTHLILSLKFNQQKRSFPIQTLCHGVIFQPCRVILGVYSTIYTCGIFVYLFVCPGDNSFFMFLRWIWEILWLNLCSASSICVFLTNRLFTYVAYLRADLNSKDLYIYIYPPK